MVKKRDDANKYLQILKYLNKDTPSIVPILLFIKVNSPKNEIFYFIAIFFRFLGLLIICCNYSNSSSVSRDHLTISIIFRSICAYGLTEKLHITNLSYIIICIILFALLAMIYILYYLTIKAIQNKNNSINFTILRIQLFFDVIFFILFPYIIEFLSFIFYIQFKSQNFIIKKELNKIVNLIIVVLNSISIIGFNIQSFFHILSVNNPLDESNNRIKLKYGRNKLLVISLMQNIIIVESLVLYLSNNYLTIYKTILNSLLIIFFIVLYLYSHYNFNYNTKTNYFINILSVFCFFSLLFEMLFNFMEYTIDSYVTLFFYTIFKIIISFCFRYSSNIIYEKKMISKLKEEIFKIYNDKNIPDIKNYDKLYYFYEIYRRINENNDQANTKIMVNIILLHLSKCHNSECKCKYIQIFPHGKKYVDEYINNFLERINFLLESIFVELDYQKNYDLTILLAEHFYNYKHNPILSYSMIQTILTFNTKSLSINQILILFTALTKYVDKYDNKYEISAGNKSSKELEKEILIEKKTNLYKNIYHNFKYLMKVKKIIKKYAKDYLQLIKYKENMEESIQLVKDENNDILKITSYFLTTRNLSIIIKILLGEFKLNKNLKLYLKSLDASKIPIDIIYKCILFSELFLCGKIPNEILVLMNAINPEINMHSQRIQENTMIKIEESYREKHLQDNSNYYIIFKFSSGINIHYFDESLSKKLRYSQKDLLKSPLDKMIPKEFKIPHNCCVLRFLINEQNRIINNFEHFIFDSEMQMYPAILSGVCMPGLGKYLFCITKLVLKSIKNEYYFYLGKSFECLSISSNFYTNYNISLNLLNKYKINPLELIEFKMEDLGELNNDILKINNYKQNLEMKTDYFYAQKLFKEKSKFNSGQNNFKLVKLMKKVDNSNFDENAELKANEDEGEKINLIEKLINLKYKYKYLKTHLMRRKITKNRKIFFSKIDEIMNKYNNENDKNVKKLISLASNFLTKYCNNKQGDKIDFGYFNIEYGLTMIYNTYFYIFRMEEIYKDIPLVRASVNSVGNLVSVNSFGAITPNGTRIRPSQTREIEKVVNEETNQKDADNKKVKSDNILVINKVQCFHYITPLVVIILGSLLITYVIILLYQRNMVSSSNKGFLVYYYNYYQRDQLYAIYSVSLSSYYHYLGLTDLSDVMEEKDYIDLIKRYSIEFQSAFHKFYDVYISNNLKDTSKIHYIFNNTEISKITNYFKNITILNNYVKESEYLGYISRLCSIEDEIDNIKKDSENLFLGKIFKNENYTKIPTKSYYGQIIYYLSKNYQSLFNTIYSGLETESTDQFNDLSSNSKKTYLYIEIMGFVIIVFFFIIVLIFLHQTNTAIFRNIVIMFINYTRDDNFHYKNKKDNYLLIRIISSFVILINDFNLDNVRKFQNIINQSSSKSMSIDSTFDIKDDSSNLSLDVIIDSKIRKSTQNLSSINNKEDFTSIVIQDNNKTNNSEVAKLNMSSSKQPLQNNANDVLKNLNNPQRGSENTTTNSNNNLMWSPKGTSKKNLIRNKSIKRNSSLNKSSKNNLIKRKVSKITTPTPKDNSKNINLKIEELSDEEKMTAQMFMKKLENNGIREIKISRIVLLILFIFVVIYVSVKIYISLNFISEIKGIFDDFGVLSYRYSSMYYYFNSLRTLLVFPEFGNETIFETMNENMADRLKKMNIVLDFKLVKYPAVGHYYWVTGTNMQKPRPSPEYINITCYEDKKCREIINNKKYDVLSEGLKMAVTSMYQQIINIYDDYKKEKFNINSTTNASYIKEKFINSQYEQIDINLNYVFTCIENRIYEAFMKDLTSLVVKYNSIIEALNICAVIYCFFVAFTVMTFIIFYLRRITKRIEEATSRINNSFSYMSQKNINNDNKDYSSFVTTDN